MHNKNSYFCIYSWMATELKLSGNLLCIFALIYGYTINSDSHNFYGNIAYIKSWLNISAPTVENSLKQLIKMNLIIKTEMVKHGFTIKYSYKANIEKLVTDGIIY